ncbi:MAG: CopD family protein [Gemmatimonadota bacterium]
MNLFYLNVTLHVLAAIAWLGGVFFLAAVGAPALRRIEPEQERAMLFRSIGQRARGYGWAAISILIITGLINLGYRGVLNARVLMSDDFWATAYGQTLGLKLLLVGLMISVQAGHDFVAGPRARQAGSGTAAGRRWRTVSVWLARSVGVAGPVLVWLAVKLTRLGFQ